LDEGPLLSDSPGRVDGGRRILRAAGRMAESAIADLS